MCNKFIRAFSCLAAVIFFTACESTGTGVGIETPRVDITCSNSKCNVSGFKDAYVVITKSGCSANQIDFESVATGAIQLLCTSSSCSGTLSSWSASSIESRSYYVCGWIDINDNSVKDSADAFSEDYIFLSGSPLTMTNWSVTYSFIRQRP